MKPIILSRKDKRPETEGEKLVFEAKMGNAGPSTAIIAPAAPGH